MPKKLIIHIGPHKAGTANIQRFLRKNSALLSENDISYLDSGSIVFSEEVLHYKFKPLVNLEDILTETKESTIILSNENFAWLYEDEITNFITWFKPHFKQINVVLYLRRQDLQVISQKQEVTKWEENSKCYGYDLVDFPASLSSSARKHLDYNKKYSEWSDAINGDISVRVFDQDSFYEGDLLKDFLFATNISNDLPFKFTSSQNTSLTLHKQIFLHSMHNSYAYGNKLRSVLVNAIKSMPDDCQKLLPSKHDAKSFYQQFEQSNKSLGRRLGWTDEIFSNSFDMYPEQTNAYQPSVLQIHELYHGILQSIMGYSAMSKQARVDILRDMALLFHNERDLDSAIPLYQTALKLRPEGKLIARKLKLAISQKRKNTPSTNLNSEPINNIKVVGDSHAGYFKILPKFARQLNLNKKITSACTEVIPGATIKGFGKRNSTLDVKNSILKNVNKKTAMVLCFGQVDIELGYYYSLVYKNSELDFLEFSKGLISTYLVFLQELSNKCHSVYVKGCNLTVLYDRDFSLRYVGRIITENTKNKNEAENKMKLLKTLYPSFEERNKHTLSFNKNLCDALKNLRNITYFDFNKSFSAHEGSKLDPQFQPSGFDHHIADTLYTRHIHYDFLSTIS